MEDIDYCGIPMGATFDPTYGYLYINMFKIVTGGRKNESVAALSYKDENNTCVTNAVKFYVDNGLFKIADKNRPAANNATYDWNVVAYLTSRTCQWRISVYIWQCTSLLRLNGVHCFSIR